MQNLKTMEYDKVRKIQRSQNGYYCSLPKEWIKLHATQSLTWHLDLKTRNIIGIPQFNETHEIEDIEVINY